MKISVLCSCGKALKVKSDLAGRKVRCPQCQEVLRVPESNSQTSDGFDLELEPTAASVGMELPSIDIDPPSEPDTYQFEAAPDPEPVVPPTATAPPIPSNAMPSPAMRSRHSRTIEIEALPKRPAVRFICVVLRLIGIVLVIIGLLGLAVCAYGTMRTTEFMPLVYGTGWLLAYSFTAVFYFAAAELLIFFCDLDSRLFEISRNIVEVSQPD